MAAVSVPIAPPSAVLTVSPEATAALPGALAATLAWARTWGLLSVTAWFSADCAKTLAAARKAAVMTVMCLII